MTAGELRIDQVRLQILVKLFRLRRTGALPYPILSEGPSGIHLKDIGLITWPQARRIAQGDPTAEVLALKTKLIAEARADKAAWETEAAELRLEPEKAKRNRARRRLSSSDWRERHDECERRRRTG